MFSKTIFYSVYHFHYIQLFFKCLSKWEEFYWNLYYILLMIYFYLFFKFLLQINCQIIRECSHNLMQICKEKKHPARSEISVSNRTTPLASTGGFAIMSFPYIFKYTANETCFIRHEAGQVSKTNKSWKLCGGKKQCGNHADSTNHTNAGCKPTPVNIEKKLFYCAIYACIRRVNEYRSVFKGARPRIWLIKALDKYKLGGLFQIIDELTISK